MRKIDELHMAEPTYGARRLCRISNRDHGFSVDRKQVSRLMRLMGIAPCWPKPRTSARRVQATRCIRTCCGVWRSKRSNQAWCADITYIPMARGYCY
ncbi:MAG: IS3 family transposase [Kiritimatiellae bacterium]|nr:IS3 family transposase [Kiritimatiellia bacterium]